jgi:molecular chaperone GrpE (heat shock protein)
MEIFGIVVQKESTKKRVESEDSERDTTANKDSILSDNSGEISQKSWKNDWLVHDDGTIELKSDSGYTIKGSHLTEQNWLSHILEKDFGNRSAGETPFYFAYLDALKKIGVRKIEIDINTDECTFTSETAPNGINTETLPNEFNEKMAKILELQETVAASLNTLEGSVQDFSHKDKINKELHEELQKYKGGLRMEFVMPLLKSIIREYDRATKQHDFYLQKLQEEQQGELFAKLLKEFNMLSLSLLDLLDDYNIAPFSPKTGGDYSSKEHKVLKAIATEDADKDSKIEKCVACGFREIESGRLIRQAEVNIYQLTK